MNLQKVKNAFQKQGYSPSTKLRRTQFDDFLSLIMNGDLFQQAVADQIWKQASKGHKLVFVDDLCSTIVEAQNIIYGKLSQFNDQIAQLQKSKKQAQASFGKRSVKVTQLQSNLQAIYEQKQQFQEDLKMLTIPFGISTNPQAKTRHSRRDDISQENDLSRSGTYQKRTTDNEELKWLLYLSLGFGVIQLIIIYGKYDFLNLIVLTCLLSIYLLSHFDPMYMKMSFALLIVSEVLDVLWLFMNAQEHWFPPTVSNHSAAQLAYMRFIVFFTVVIVFLKIPLGYLLYQYRNASGDQKYNLELGLVKILLTPNKINPISRGLTNSLGPIA